MILNLQQKGEEVRKEADGVDQRVVVVAIKASKEIPRTALVWALTHVVQPGDCVNLLVLIPAQTSGKKLWGFPRFTSDCTNYRRSLSGTSSDQKDDITDSCSQMMHQLHDSYDSDKINVKIKIVSGSPCGAVAAEAKKAQTNWVVLDKQLKNEEKICMEELQCNVVVMKRSQPKVLRLNLVDSPKIESQVACHLLSASESSAMHQSNKQDLLNTIQGLAVTPASSPDQGTLFTATDVGTSPMSSSDPGASPVFISRVNGDLDSEGTLNKKENKNLDKSESGTDDEKLSPRLTYFQPWMADILDSGGKFSRHLLERSQNLCYRAQTSTSEALLDKGSKCHRECGIELPKCRLDLDLSKNVREVISLSRNAPPVPPPLCSICQHKAPEFGKPPRWFTYAELDLATGGFSQANFLAEGGYGSVHRGILPDGQVIAVKQHKLASSQGDLEFCSEVEVLSCAQHRNVVTLIGFCVEDKRRLLVYEYICNGSLDSHLYGHNCDPLVWSARQKIAVGAARGLRYLHEECRMGCIVHRDMRPNNILVTHDFEPLVGDFGLARWQPDGDMSEQTRVIGTFGYLAPEYAQTGQITEKADVYSFGVVLVELVTGRKAVDINQPRGQHCLTEWARPLLEEHAISELIDPHLMNSYSEQEVYNMLHCASLCIQRDPQSRPRMSQDSTMRK
ncbi:inactive protein kinase SELMODRAFT_444075-like isoform X2 [Malania oleifera]|uniref:inactive protein kinase SELMODRAFT_444075-like isoform X2 n=1 Tax=Malania oleifera TaxID=397392 RepID=UPI0025AE6D61|nr:inactive protein kinase SELMODRAFT_444075-like isoform X2 [Malania oleifera]